MFQSGRIWPLASRSIPSTLAPEAAREACMFGKPGMDEPGMTWARLSCRV
ncbi:Uncharacterised protein [Bordetella pertussis]|nr:Uncharacterised protein [Bordetella pertussis]CPI01632.1 Uncharacterised protein [Bordetella pertussis]CPL74354.1 Uncharacterised protein [Bordetella pertussis]